MGSEHQTKKSLASESSLSTLISTLCMQVKLPYAIRVLIVCYKEDLVRSCLSSSTLTMPPIKVKSGSHVGDENGFYLALDCEK